ncbi:hypothetical protein EJB05_14649, partial [Eragrostis curvula]
MYCVNILFGSGLPKEAEKGAVDKLTYDIFSILERKFLSGRGVARSSPSTVERARSTGSSPSARWCVSKQRCGGKQQQDARLADFFDVAGGRGSGFRRRPHRHALRAESPRALAAASGCAAAAFGRVFGNVTHSRFGRSS